MNFSESLREWRQTRRLSQMALATEAGISARHLSFLETGRSRPTPGMILRIADTLDLPASGRNELLAAAGFAPRHGDSGGNIAQLGDEIGGIIQLILERHAPWPAACFNDCYEVMAANAGFAGMAAGLGLEPGGNIVSQIFQPGPLRNAIANWDEFAPAMLRRLHAEARFRGPRSRLARMMDELAREPGILPNIGQTEPGARTPPYIGVSLMIAGMPTQWMSTITTVGSAQDVLLEGISIEQFFPMDEPTRLLADRLAAPANK